MALINNLKHQLDLPVWEWCRFAPSTTSATSHTCVGEGLGQRYIYYLQSSVFYRYDTISDSWMQLASPWFNMSSVMAMRYSTYSGFRGKVISATSSTVTMAGLKGDVLVGSKLNILTGKGAGQVRTITAVSENGISEYGVVTAASSTQLTDSTKKWRFNEWVGYQVAITYGTGNTQRRKVLYNDHTTLYFSDNNYQQIDPFNNVAFSGTSPYAAPVATAGVQSNYALESSTLSVDAPWTVAPDNTSKIQISSGGIWVVSSASAAPFYTLQYYDVAADVWMPKTAMSGIFTGALGTDLALEKISTDGGLHLTSTVTSVGATRSAVDTTQTLPVDRFANYQFRVVGGTGMGQRRRIQGHTSNTFYFSRKLETPLDATSVYEIWDDVHNSYIMGNGQASLFQYHTEADLLAQGSVNDYGLTRNMAVRINGWEDVAVSTATRNTNGINTINPTPVAGGTNHVVGDIVTLGTGSGGKVRVEAVNPGGIVTSVSVLAVGANYTVATHAQTATTGAGTGLTVAVTGLSPVVGRIVTAINHTYKIGQQITFSGAVEATWNNTFTIAGCDAVNALDIVGSFASTAVAALTNSTTVVVDSAANWDVNEHVGNLVTVTTSGVAPTTQIRRIVSNTATSLTLQSAITAAGNGTSRYIITDIAMNGRDEQFRIAGKGSGGYATGGTTSTLTDTTKNWDANQWAGAKFQISSGVGLGNELTVISNTTNTLTYSTQTFTPDATTRYDLFDTYGLATAGSTTTLTDTTKKWVVNQFAGKRVRITSGTAVGNEYTITSNTATVLTFGTATAPGTDSTYTIVGIPSRGAGISLFHLYGLTKPNTRGRYLVTSRGGGSNTFDKYDITTETWEYGIFFRPQSETLTTGSMYAYDGIDTLYFTKDATGRIYALNVNANTIENASTIPYGMSTAIIGNRMEVVRTVDGIKYLYVMRHTGTEMFRSIMFF